MELDNLKENWQNQQAKTDDIKYNRLLGILQNNEYNPLNSFVRKNKKRLWGMLALLGIWVLNDIQKPERLSNPLIWTATLSIIVSLFFNLKNYMIANRLISIDSSLKSNIEMEIVALIKNRKDAKIAGIIVIILLAIVIELMITFDIPPLMPGWANTPSFFRILAYLSFVFLMYIWNRFYTQPKFENNIGHLKDLLEAMS
ncbi:hypothetical protein A9P82_06890 [Arachidicoccus ginsenosidimutans]|uniref:hypothetical protein n=1 Tax=Arachidicoccus sp. BS20 TaxID=1850526 RepID=UPI0007F11EE8|nr:hypothetical protein [Arachidicoccus sp. BS20]ANI89042.1 hypothetical protein A9P82_06890 [Arachidicoccus sp. BS20]